MASVSTDRRQGVNSSAALKIPCKVATTGVLVYPFNGLTTIDGVMVSPGDRVLVWNQTDLTQNGIWNADTGNWSRALDFDGAFDAVNGTQVFVTSGHSLSTLYFSLTTPNPITIGSSNITFALIPAPSSGAQTPYIVDSIAVLKSILTPAAALTYIVRGFAAVGDGGGGFYWWNAADVTADNGGTVIQLNIGGAGRFNKLF